MKGKSYTGLMHVTDWLPTFMGLATNGQWSGSLSGSELDGVDMWSAIMANGDSPRQEILHRLNDVGFFGIQQGSMKLINENKAPVQVPDFIFQSDLAEELSSYKCADPTLMSTNTETKYF